MPGQKTFIIDAQDLYQLLVHHTDGDLPLAGEVREVGVNPYLGRMVGLYIWSDEWETDTPYQVRYDGRRVATWSKGDGEMQFVQRNETPRLQR